MKLHELSFLQEQRSKKDETIFRVVSVSILITFLIGAFLMFANFKNHKKELGKIKKEYLNK